jgi:hypothetical protein
MILYYKLIFLILNFFSKCRTLSLVTQMMPWTLDVKNYDFSFYDAGKWCGKSDLSAWKNHTLPILYCCLVDAICVNCHYVDPNLLAVQYNLNQRTFPNGWTLVGFAASEQDCHVACKMLDFLRAAGAKMDTPDGALSIAWDSTNHGNWVIFQRLLEHGAKATAFLQKIRETGLTQRQEWMKINILQRYVDREKIVVIILSRRIQIHVRLHRDTAKLIAQIFLKLKVI